MTELNLNTDGHSCAIIDLIHEIDSDKCAWLNGKTAKVMPLSFLDKNYIDKS